MNHRVVVTVHLKSDLPNGPYGVAIWPSRGGTVTANVYVPPDAIYKTVAKTTLDAYNQAVAELMNSGFSTPVHACMEENRGKSRTVPDITYQGAVMDMKATANAGEHVTFVKQTFIGNLGCNVM